MPFAGSAEEGAAALTMLTAISRAPGDELIAADNSKGQVLSTLAPRWPEVTIVAATAQQSSYYARNVAAASASNEWLLFIDADCRPTATILDAYLAQPPVPREGALAGAIMGETAQTTLTARYARERGHLDQARNLEHPFRPYAVTANMLVRASALRSVGGFLEGIRSGGDTDFSWRLQAANWTLGYRPQARVRHRHRETLRAFARVTVRYAAGRAWLNRRYPGALAVAPLRAVPRAVISALFWLATGQRERGLFRALDALVIAIDRGGGLLSNSTGPKSPRRADVVVFTDTFPAISETFIGAELQALGRLGVSTRVEASRRPEVQDIAVARATATTYLEDEAVLGRIVDVARLALRHPFRCLSDLRNHGRWRAAEPVVPLRTLAPAAKRLRSERGRLVHVHFAANAALNAMRLAAIERIPYTLTAHAYEIFREPRNLEEKLERAAVVTTGCDYNVEYLRRLVTPAAGARIKLIVMGVDPARFKRRLPYNGGRNVVAVGRLVEKKGFEFLIEAAALLREHAAIERLAIVGSGPLQDRLRRRIEELALEDTVELLGALDQEAVRDEIERADLLVMPSVIAADGDRDSMPVVVKEALALEIPVVASDEVGLPEVVKPQWGRLVPPADPAALAAAIAELLALDPAQRVAMGAAGRRFVIEHCNVEHETSRLLELLAAARDAVRD